MTSLKKGGFLRTHLKKLFSMFLVLYSILLVLSRGLSPYLVKILKEEKPAVFAFIQLWYRLFYSPRLALLAFTQLLQSLVLNNDRKDECYGRASN